MRRLCCARKLRTISPLSSDLEYPRNTSRPPTSASVAAPLSGRRSNKPTTPNLKSPEIVDEDNSDHEKSSFPWSLASRNAILLQNTYPTLPRAIRLLSRIYRLVNSSVFDDLAHQIVHQTTISLANASALIAKKSSLADGQLFLLRHLLLLKSQIVAFDIEFVTPDVSFDFSGVANTFYELRERGGLFNYRNWLKLFSTGGLLPRVVENMLDAKVELDGQLRNVINDFTRGFAETLTAGLPLPQNGKTSKDKTKVEDAVSSTRQTLETEVPVLRAKLEQYLDDQRTRETLVAAVEDQVVQIYETFFDGYLEGGSKANGTKKGSISRKGKSPEDAVWDSDTFAEWCEGIFNVALPRNGDGDGGSRSRMGSVGSLSRSGSS